MANEKRSFLLHDALRHPDLAAYQLEFVLIDCPPSLNLLTVNAMVAADSVLVPLQSEFFALEGLSQLMTTVREVRQAANPRLRIEGVVLTMFDGRNRLTQYVSAELEKHFSERVFSSVIPRNIKLAEAPSHGKPVMYHEPKSQGALAYLALSAEIDRKANAKQYANLLKESV